MGSMRPLQFLTIGGFILAAVSTMLPWLKASAAGLGSDTVKAWDKGVYKDLQLADWAGASFPLDAIVVVAIAVVALYLIFAPMLTKQSPVNLPFIGIGVAFGAALIAVGVLNYLHLKDQIDKLTAGGGAGLDVSVGIGVYLCIVGGAVAIVGAFLDQQQQSKM